MPSESICAYCRKQPAEPAWRPFCSQRCQLADLGHWLSGDYRLAGDPLPSDDPDGGSDGPEDDR